MHEVVIYPLSMAFSAVALLALHWQPYRQGQTHPTMNYIGGVLAVIAPWSLATLLTNAAPAVAVATLWGFFVVGGAAVIGAYIVDSALAGQRVSHEQAEVLKHVR